MTKLPEIPTNYNNTKKWFDDITSKQNFFICLLNVDHNFKIINKIEPIKISHIQKINKFLYLITYNNKQIKYNNNIYYFDDYIECCNFYNQLIDNIKIHFIKYQENEKEKFNNLFNIKINFRKEKFKRLIE